MPSTSASEVTTAVGPISFTFTSSSVIWVNNQGAIAHPVQLLRFGHHLAGHGNAHIVVREQLVHRVHIGVQLGGAPDFLQLLYLVLVLILRFGCGSVRTRRLCNHQAASSSTASKKQSGTETTNWSEVQRHRTYRIVVRFDPQSQNKVA